jgi:hypothetical protein
MPVAGRAGISSALIVDERVLVIDCGRGSPSAFANAGLDFSRLEAVFLTHDLGRRMGGTRRARLRRHDHRRHRRPAQSTPSIVTGTAITSPPQYGGPTLYR